MITNNQFDNFKKDLDKLIELYKEKYFVDKKRNWQEYEKGRSPLFHSGFAADKKSNGWKVWQKMDDRISTSIMCKALGIIFSGSERVDLCPNPPDHITYL